MSALTLIGLVGDSRENENYLRKDYFALIMCYLFCLASEPSSTFIDYHNRILCPWYGRERYTTKQHYTMSENIITGKPYPIF